MTRPNYYEAGDPLYEALSAEERADHQKARARGERLRTIAETIVDRLVGDGVVSADERLYVPICSVLADCLYGNLAIEIPTRPRGRV